MKGFKNSTKTQSGHGYDEVPTRPATSKDVAAAKAVRIITPGKSTPRVTDSMILGESEDKAPGERGGKKFAVGGLVPPVASGGMPALGKPLTNQNTNDGRLAPPRPARPAMPVAPKGPLIGKGGLPQAWRDNYAADSARRLGVNPQPTARDLANRAADAARSTGTPPAPARPTSAQMAALPTTKAYKKGGKVVEKGSKEVYTSKAAMKKHEGKESKAKERAEHKQEGGELLAGRAQSLRDMTMKPSGRAGYAKGGKSRWS